METNGNESVAFVEKIQSITRDADEIRIKNIGEGVYYDAQQHTLHRIEDFAPSPVKLRTLSGLCSIVNKERTRYDMTLFVIVNDHQCVTATTTLLKDMERDEPYVAQADRVEFPFSSFIPIEKMIITLRSKFLLSEDSEYLCNLLASVTNGESIQTQDDGVTQKIEARKGISLKGIVNTKPIVKLKPFRTFAEVEQPASEFLFRLKDMGDGEVCAALFEADGGAWKNEAMQNIKSYLELQFKNTKNVFVIA